MAGDLQPDAGRTISRRWAIAALAAGVLMFGAVGGAGAGSSSYDLSGVWTNPAGPGTTITITQKGASITWIGGPNDHAWIQNFAATLGADNRFSGTFWQDAPGVSPQRYHGTINGTVVDNCRIELVDVIQTGQATLHNVIFNRQPCTSASKTGGSTSLHATITSTRGDVEYRHGSAGSFATLTNGVVLHEGDYIATGFGSSVTLNLGYGTLKIGPTTQLRLDEFVDPTHLGKTQLFLNVGTIEARVKHVAGVRSDFSVRTAIVSASIRGSEMVISARKGAVTVYAVTDVAYVKGSADPAAITVRHGFETSIGAARKASKPTRYPPSALPIK